MGKENLNHVEPVFDALMPTKVEFPVLEISLDKIPFWGNQNLCCTRKTSVHLGVHEADCEVSSFIQQCNFLHLGQLALQEVSYKCQGQHTSANSSTLNMKPPISVILDDSFLKQWR